jgi:hypothetical protein
MKNAKQIHAKQLVLEKFDDDTYIPKSARLNFNLGVSEIVSKSDKYTDLVTTATTNKATYESNQKAIIKQAAQLEVNVLVTSNKTLFCEALFKIASIYYLKHTKSPEFDEAKVHELVSHVVHQNTCIIRYTFNKETIASFITYYNTIYIEAISSNDDQILDDADVDDDAVYSQIDIDAEINQHLSRNASSTVSVATTETNDNHSANCAKKFPTELIHQISALMMRLFVHDWEAYKNAHDEKVINAQMEKFATTTMAHKATDKAAEIIAAEPSATPQQISDLIAKEVNKKVSHLVNEVNTLKQRLAGAGNTVEGKKDKKNNNINIVTQHNNNNSAKERSRGETRTRASNKNKSKTNTNTTTNRNNPQQNQIRPKSKSKPKADAVARGTSNGRRRQQSNSNNNKTPEKTTGTRNRQRGNRNKQNSK